MDFGPDNVRYYQKKHLEIIIILKALSHTELFYGHFIYIIVKMGLGVMTNWFQESLFCLLKMCIKSYFKRINYKVNSIFFTPVREPIDNLTPEERDARTVFCMQLAARIRPRDLEEFFSTVGKVI